MKHIVKLSQCVSVTLFLVMGLNGCVDNNSKKCKDINGKDKECSSGHSGFFPINTATTSNAVKSSGFFSGESSVKSASSLGS